MDVILTAGDSVKANREANQQTSNVLFETKLNSHEEKYEIK